MFQQSKIKLALFYVVAGFFILLNVFFIVKKHSLIINVLPLALLVVLFAFFALDKLLYLVVFFSPLSLPLSTLFPGLSFDMFLPTEPLLFGVLLIFLLKIFADRGFDRRILFHPVTLLIFLNLFWMLITSVTSTMPVVSFKFLLSRVWFIVGFYFIAYKLFEDAKNIERYVWIYTIPLIIVMSYATYRHLGYGLWDKQASHFVVNPFYNDHTSYGAVLAMYLPFMVGFSFSKAFSPSFKIFARIAMVIVFSGLILSYSRAAWVSVVAAIGVWGIMRLKIRFKPLFITFLVLLSVLLVFQKQMVMYLERNDEESSANLMEHVSSISNISSDASNLERINRWSCALRMFTDKPLLGYGPGTYMFQYAPYQLTKDRTIISTNSADGGNAHSEYFGPLAESGLLGSLTFLLIIGYVIFTGVHAYFRTDDKRLKTYVMCSLLGLITYYVHGTMNNFLDTDKLSVPFWGFTAIIVAIDIYTMNKKELKAKA